MKTMQQLFENKNLNIDELSLIKRELKQKINDQQEQMFVSAKRLVPFSKASGSVSISPLSLITTPFRKGKTISVVEGMVVGYKLVKNIRRFFWRR